MLYMRYEADMWRGVKRVYIGYQAAVYGLQIYSANEKGV
jgi:hypothetical protein